MTPDPNRSWALDVAIYVFGLAVLLAAVAVLGMGFDGDGFSYLIWGRELATGMHLNRANPCVTAPKILPILIAAVGHWLPGEHGAEWFCIAVTIAAGAGVVALTSRLARRMGGLLAGLLAVPLVLGHMQFLRYVTSGQSTILASLFIVAALLVATREDPASGGDLWAAVLVFAAGLCRPEAAVLGPALGLAVYLRLGWRRPWWPALLAVVGLSSAAANLLFHRVAFGSFTYTTELASYYGQLHGPGAKGLTVGFAVSVVKTVLHYANRSWVMVLLAGVGAGALFGARHRARYLVFLLFALATAAFMWLMLARGMCFVERCLYYLSFVVIALASAGAGRLAAWAGSSTGEEFLAGLSPRWRSAGFVALVLAVLAPVYGSRPLPAQGKHYKQMERACAFLAPKLAGLAKPPRVLVSDEMGHLFYRLALPPDASCVHLSRTPHGEGSTLPADIAWYVMNEQTSPDDVPASWGLKLAWKDKTGRVRIYHRGGEQEGGS